MSDRLTKAVKQLIVNAVVDKTIPHKYGPTVEAIHIEVRNYINNLYPKEIQAWIDKSPKGGLQQRSKFQVYLTDWGDVYHKYFKPESRYRYYFTVPAKALLDKDRSENLLIPKKHKSYKVIRNLIKELGKVEKQEEKLRETVWSALNACTTVKKLNTNYPDLVPFIPKSVNQANTALMVTNDQIAKVINS